MNKCPKCGSEVYYIKQRYYGRCCYYIRFDGNLDSGGINGDMHDGASYSNTSKYAWCAECGKRLFKIDDQGKEANHD